MTHLVNKTDLAIVFGVTNKTIDNWRKAGMPRVGERRATRYDTAKCIKWHADQKLKESFRKHDIGSQIVDEKTAKAKKASFEAALTELEYREAVNETVTTKRVEKYVDSLITQLKDAVMGIPGQWSDQVLGLKDRTEAIDRLDELSRKLLKSIAAEELNMEEE